MMFPFRKKKHKSMECDNFNPKMLQFSITIVYLSFLFVCFRESGLNVPSKHFLLSWQAAKWKRKRKHKNATRKKKKKNQTELKIFLFSNVGVSTRAVFIFDFSRYVVTACQWIVNAIDFPSSQSSGTRTCDVTSS